MSVFDKTREGRCHCCHKTTAIRNIPIYWIGSEGTDICKPCEIKVAEFIASLSSQATEKGKQEFLAKRAAEKKG